MQKHIAMLTPLISIALLLLFIFAGCATPSQIMLDAEVKRLCAIDGGIKVYETVRLPPEKFNKYGQINFYKPTQGEDTLGPEYIYKWDIHYYKKSEPSMRRDHIKIIRKSDMKLLGEVVMYNRGGGDLPGPWAPSAYHCPDRLEATEGILMSLVFIKFGGVKSVKPKVPESNSF